MDHNSDSSTPSQGDEKENPVSELTVPSGKGESNCTQQRTLSTNFKIGLVLIGLAVVAGVALNWNWLVAAGLLPIIVGLLPCAAMCGLHLCSGNQGSNQSPGSMTKVPPPGS